MAKLGIGFYDEEFVTTTIWNNDNANSSAIRVGKVTPMAVPSKNYTIRVSVEFNGVDKREASYRQTLASVEISGEELTPLLDTAIAHLQLVADN
jgi:hypothetical protein